MEVQARVEGTSEWTPPIRLDVEVAPFWYETLLARLGMLALLFATVFAGVRMRLRSLRRHAAMLEATVEERTAQLAEKVELLHESEQRALAASSAKSAFLANMSHELRTPLNGVLGFAQLLARRKNRDAEDQEGLAVIMKSGEHLLGLINDVLSLSKIEAGRVTLEQAPFDLLKLVKDAEDVLQMKAREKGLHLRTRVDSEVPSLVDGDEGRIRQILLNLIGNAIKFTADGEVVLHVRWKEGRAEFDVRDTGVGIAAEELPRLFEPFVQTDSGHRSKEGTGLGLALSRDLARLMGGDITVTSTVGEGSCFHVVIHLPEATADSIAPVRETRRVASLAKGQIPPRVLVVDDISVNRVVLTRLLRSVGFDVSEAANGHEALNLWEHWRPQLIWMDKWMPGIDGLEVTRRIRAAEKREHAPRTPIIALSASALEQERGEILGAGCDDFVAKPFREGTIFAKLHDYLGVEYVYEEPSPPPSPRPAAPSPAPATATSNGSVLLVDDDWVCRQVAQQLLRDNGVDVTSASSGAEALTLIATKVFDLVLMDMQMPGMDGRETTRRIKAASNGDRLPIVAMTADSFDEQGSLAEAGMDDYIAKPIEPEAVTRVLHRWLRAPAS